MFLKVFSYKLEFEYYKNNNKSIKFIVIIFIIAFIISSFFQRNLFLKNEGIGLFEHINIWIFFLYNFFVPTVFKILIKKLKVTVNEDLFCNLKNNFEKEKSSNKITIIGNIIRLVGFCFFIGNSLQNSKLLNIINFEFWDSTSFILSYILTRIYKLYLFCLFIPLTYQYIITNIFAISKTIKYNINESEAKFPIKDLLSINYLCRFGLNLIFILIAPSIIIAVGVFFVHNQADITTIFTILIAVLTSLLSILFYYFLIKEYYKGIFKYKNYFIEIINTKLIEIHDIIINLNYSKIESEKLNFYYQKEKYLSECKKEVKSISIYPSVLKLILTTLSPIIPIILKLILSRIERFFNF